VKPELSANPSLRPGAPWLTRTLSRQAEDDIVTKIM
jgi:hypothetical protein